MRSAACSLSAEAFRAPPRHRAAPQRAPQHRTAPTKAASASSEHKSRPFRSPKATAMLHATRSAPSLEASTAVRAKGRLQHAPARPESRSLLTDAYGIATLDPAKILASRGSYGRSASNLLAHSLTCVRTVPHGAATPVAYGRWMSGTTGADRTWWLGIKADSVSDVLGPRKTRQMSRRTFFSLGGGVEVRLCAHTHTERPMIPSTSRCKLTNRRDLP